MFDGQLFGFVSGRDWSGYLHQELISPLEEGAGADALMPALHSTDVGWGGEAETYSWTPDAGTYYVIVEAWSGETGEYAFSFYD